MGYNHIIFCLQLNQNKMKTTTMRTIGIVFSAGVLLTSCVSSKKYHKSEAEVAKLRNDSTTLAQQGTTLQQNLAAMQQKNSDLQKTIDNGNNTNAGLVKNVAYYHDYSDKQQASTMQIKGDLSTALASSGLTDQDVTLTDGKIYINVGEKSLFKGNSAVLTSKGQDLVNNLGQFVKSHDGVDVSVADLQQANMTGTMASPDAVTTTDQSKSTTNSNDGMTSSGTAKNAAKSKWKASEDNTSTSMTDKTAHKSVAVHHRKKVQATNGESKAVAYSSGHHNKYTAERNNRSMARAIAWKRQNAVTDALLKNGIPKVKVVAQNQTGTENATAQKGVQVILVNNMDEFYKHMTEAPAGQPVSANP
jgi:outer membrane murein-binding lipoprotein Lpp